MSSPRAKHKQFLLLSMGAVPFAYLFTVEPGCRVDAVTGRLGYFVALIHNTRL